MALIAYPIKTISDHLLYIEYAHNLCIYEPVHFSQMFVIICNDNNILFLAEYASFRDKG